MHGLSIIIPLYNKASTIESTLESAFAQTYSNFEVIVVDDGSTDDSVKRLEPFKNKITFISQNQKGPSAARNLGAKYAKYSVLAFLDADDYIAENFVETHMLARQSHPQVQLSMNSFDVLDENALQRRELLFERCPLIPQKDQFYLLTGFDTKFVSNIHSSGFCVNKEVFDLCTGFDENLRCWEITDALSRFSIAAEHKAIINEILSYKFEGDPKNSQFNRERNNLDELRNYCRNIIRYLPDINGRSKKLYFSILYDLCIMLWQSRRWLEMAYFYHITKTLSDSELYFSPHPKIWITARFIGLFKFTKKISDC